MEFNFIPQGGAIGGRRGTGLPAGLRADSTRIDSPTRPEVIAERSTHRSLIVGSHPRPATYRSTRQMFLARPRNPSIIAAFPSHEGPSTPHPTHPHPCTLCFASYRSALDRPENASSLFTSPCLHNDPSASIVTSPQQLTAPSPLLSREIVHPSRQRVSPVCAKP